MLTPSSPKITAFDYVAASAKGFAAGEKSRFAYKKFMRDVTEKAPDFICLAYGQVDAEVGYYYRKYVAGSTASPEADLSAVYEAYVAMAGQVLPGRKLVFKGLNPSTLRNETQLVTYAYRRLTARMTDEGERQALADVLANAGLTVAAHAGINRMANEILAQRRARRDTAFSISAIRRAIPRIRALPRGAMSPPKATSISPIVSRSAQPTRPSFSRLSMRSMAARRPIERGELGLSPRAVSEWSETPVNLPSREQGEWPQTRPFPAPEVVGGPMPSL
ncbi:hypothetical protein QWZ10_24340 [Paracoccus cavernae]|uniref:Uncharacterized protein n=1 Tax=Paracoccus cavernae TaxID=1571207 RepID=A0ABT8DEM1_9RHOB|nr:hypothetical protein [Paracoccus cavernae]